jgi:hypothetical protein
MIEYAYVARCRTCGQIVAMTTDKPERTNQTAEQVYQWICDGETVNRMTVDEATAAWNENQVCECYGEVGNE